MTAGAVKRNGLRLSCVPEARPPDPSTPQKTPDNALGYSCNRCTRDRIVLPRGPKPNLFEEFEAEFKSDLAVRESLPFSHTHLGLIVNLFQWVAYPQHSCPVVTHARGMLLINVPARPKGV